jgi:hypothetical protein
MKLKRPSNTSIYGTTNFDYKGTYKELRKSKDIQSLSQTQKGHITCWLKEYNVFAEISPNGKLIVYYDRQNDHNKAIRLLLDSDKKLIICDSFELIQDVPRTLQSMQEGIEAGLKDLIDPDLILSLNYDNYILPTAPPKNYKMVCEGIRNYLTRLLEEQELRKTLG